MRRDQLKRDGADKPPLGPVLDHYGAQFVPDYAGWQKVLCPVHDEDRPSCTLNLDECQWHCHACQAHGDVFDLVMIKETCDYPTAKTFVESLAGDHAPVRGRVRSTVRDDDGRAPRFRRAVPAGVRYRTRAGL